MIRLLGIFLMVAGLYGVVVALDENVQAELLGLLGVGEGGRSLGTHQTLGRSLGYYGVLTLGAGILIVSGGIDLSIGSVVGLGAVCFGLMLGKEVPLWEAALAVIVGSALIGLTHGLLVTRLHLQPFLVTLCGLFVYRGLAKWASPTSVGLEVRASSAYLERIDSFRRLFVGQTLGVPHQLLLLLLVAALLGLLLHGTRYGRYLYAIGANEEAARYAGIPTDRYKVLAYVLCSTLAGLGSVLYLLENRSALPTQAGTWQELYAITGAVLGGCSLRGGVGTVPGMLLGAAVLPLLRQLCVSANITNELEYAVIGGALLLGTIADELLKRRGARQG
jgi:ribose transport system permease protein